MKHVQQRLDQVADEEMLVPEADDRRAHARVVEGAVVADLPERLESALAAGQGAAWGTSAVVSGRAGRILCGKGGPAAARGALRGSERRTLRQHAHLLRNGMGTRSALTSTPVRPSDLTADLSVGGGSQPSTYVRRRSRIVSLATDSIRVVTFLWKTS